MVREAPSRKNVFTYFFQTSGNRKQSDRLETLKTIIYVIIVTMKLSIEDRLEIIEKRNEKVEVDKAWETSITRRLIIAITTYIIIGIYLSLLNVSSPWLNAIVPVVGFILSTLVIQKIKNIWMTKRFKK